MKNPRPARGQSRGIHSDTKKAVRKEEGQWRVYKDGKLVNTLPADAQPGLTNKKELDLLIKEKK